MVGSPWGVGESGAAWTSCDRCPGPDRSLPVSCPPSAPGPTGSGNARNGSALPGAPTPDYTLPDDFINPAGDTLTYTGTDTLVLGPLPTDGTTSFDRVSGAGRLNTPTNLAGDMGSIDALSRVSAAAPLPIAGLILMIGLMMSIAARMLGPRRRVEV